MGTSPKGTVPTTHPPRSQDEVWSWIQNNINTGNYIGIIDWLQTSKNSQEASSRTDRICQAAIDLCKICQRHQVETESSWETFQRAVTQEKALGSNLAFLLKTILPEVQDKTFTTVSPEIQKREQQVPSSTLHQSEKLQPGIWQRVQQFFNRSPITASAIYPKKTLSDQPYITELIASGTNQSSPANANTATEETNNSTKEIKEIDTPSLENQEFPTLLVPETNTPPVEAHKKTITLNEGVPSLAIYTLGKFCVYQDDIPILEWSSSKSASLFKYLLAHREEKIAKEILMELFWPDGSPDAARNNLNVTIYNLRKTLRDGYQEFSHILFQDGFYLPNPKMFIWVDAEAFEESVKQGRDHERNGRYQEAIQNYHEAEALYQGDYLSEDRYEDWPIPLRQKLQDMYLSILDKLSTYYFRKEELTVSMGLCRQILSIDPCREEAHRELMLSYYQLGQPYLALRQFHQCSENLQNELDITPSEETIHLMKQIQNHEKI